VPTIIRRKGEKLKGGKKGLNTLTATNGDGVTKVLTQFNGKGLLQDRKSRHDSSRRPGGMLLDPWLSERGGIIREFDLCPLTGKERIVVMDCD